MAYDFHWHDDEHTIIRAHIHSNPTWDEYLGFIDKTVEELKKTTHRIDVILDGSASDMPPGSPMSHIKTSSEKLIGCPNIGVVIVVTTQKMSKFTQMMVSMVYKIYGIDPRILGGFTTTLAEDGGNV